MADVDIDVDINTDDAINDIRRLNGAVESFDDHIRRADDTTKKFERRLGGSFRSALQDVRVLLGAIGIGVFLREMVNVNTAFEQVKTTLVAASDSMAIVASDFSFIRSEATRLGMPVSQVGGEFARLAAATKGTRLEGEPARQVFSSLAESFIATGQSADEFRLAILAVNQMVSKGRVQAEELRGQLGERLPGAYQAAARAMGMTTAELGKALEMGQVTAEKLLPALSVELRKTFGSAFEAAANSPKFIMGQFQVAVESLLYTLSNQGFMVQFLGMLKDISSYLSSDEGARGAERLGSALGFLMTQVREAAGIVVRNFDSIVAVLAGAGTAGAILGLRTMASMMMNLAKASGLLSVLAGPWGWLAIGIGVAVGLVAKYGDALITLGGQTARLGDWFKAAFDVPSERIKNDLLPAIRDMIVQIPVIGDLFLAASTGLKVFVDMFAATKSLSEAFKFTMGAVADILRNGLGEETFGKLMGIVTGLQTGFQNLKPYIDMALQGIWLNLQVAWIAVQEFGRQAITVFMDIWENVKGIAAGIWSALSNVFTLAMGLFGQMDPKQVMGGFFAFAAAVADVLSGVVLTVLDVVEFAIGLVAKFIDAIMPVLEPVANAIGAVLAKVVDYIAKIAGANIDTKPFESLNSVFQFMLNVVGAVVGTIGAIVQGVSNVVGQVLSAVFDVIGGVWTAVEDIFSAIFDVFKFLAQGSYDSAKTSAEAQAAGAASSADSWIKMGDIGVGVFISIIEIIGQVIKQLTNLVQAIIEVGRRFADFFGAIGEGFSAMIDRDVDKAASAKARFEAIFTKPISVGFANDFTNFTAGFGDNFNVVSGAVNAGKEISSSFSQLGPDISSNFGHASSMVRRTQERAFGPNSELQTEAAANGVALAAAYFGGMSDEIGKRASTLTNAASEQQKKLDESQRAAAQEAAKAFADREAGIDRTPETAADGKKGGGGKNGRGGRSPGERASDRIKELAVEIMMNNQLTKSLETQSLTQEQLSATIKATEALRRAGYDMTYDQAIANGGMAKQLAAIAYEAEISEQALNKAKKAAEAIGSIGIENSGLQTQLRAAQELNISRKEYGFQAEAMKELQQAGINMTYSEAIAAGGLAKQLAEVARQRAINKDSLNSAEAVADAIDGYTYSAQALQQYAAAAASGTRSSVMLDAQLAAQQTVMQATNETVWKGYDALKANEKALYDKAIADNLVNSTGQTFIGLSNSITEAYNNMVNPLQNARNATLEWQNSSMIALQAMYNNLAVKTPEIVALYQDLMNQINTITKVEMMRNSNSLSDRFMAGLIDMEVDVNNWAGNISNIWDNAVSGMTDALTDFVMTGKADFGDLALSIIKDITKMMIKWLAFQALKMAGRFFGLPIPFADGGIMSSAGSMPLKTYSKGGIANSPQLSLFGEGRTPEAYVPLPDGRTIPVTLSGMDGGAGAVQNIYNTYNFDPMMMLKSMTGAVDSVYEAKTSNLDTDTRRSDQVYANSPMSMGDINITTEVHYTGDTGMGGGSGGQDDNKGMEKLAKDVSELVKVKVIEVIQNETRPGGVLNRDGRR